MLFRSAAVRDVGALQAPHRRHAQHHPAHDRCLDRALLRLPHLVVFSDQPRVAHAHDPRRHRARLRAPADGQFLFFASCADINIEYGPGKEKGFGSCDIFYTDKASGKWIKPVNIGRPVNSNHWETQPSFSSDGKTLYFVRGIQGRGQRTGDIYYSVLGDDGKFREPIKLGPNINTEQSEESVFIHPDNMTLYFASNGRVGMGGMDLYMSKRQANGEWGPAVNLGYPINTCKDENSLLVDPSGRLAYFASNREGGFGNLDIYYFELPQEFQPEKITFSKGFVYDSLSRKPLSAAVELIDLEPGK